MGVYIMSNSQKFTDEQKKLIESNFDNVYENLKKALIIIELVKSSLVDEDSDSINKNTSPYDTREALKIVTEYLAPVKSYICEVTCDSSHILDETFLRSEKDINLKEEVTK
jgi:hypothetical protein